VAQHLFVGGMPGGQTHHHIGQVGTLRLVLLRQFNFARPGGCYGSGHGEGDATAGASLQRATHGLAGVLHHVQSCGGVVGMEVDARTVDAVQQVEADVGLAGNVERIVDESARFFTPALVQRQFRQAL